MGLRNALQSPKRNHSSGQNSSNLYHYYAGFSSEFVSDVLTRLDIHPNAIIMDPWNGSGTTTQVAKARGFSAKGFDINPVMAIIAKAKLLDFNHIVRNRILQDLDSIIERASDFQDGGFHRDPLETWLESKSAACFRNIERAIQLQLVSSEYDAIYSQKSLVHISCLASFFYLALFKTLRKFLASCVSSNPTWIKTPRTEEDCLCLTSDEVYTSLRNEIYKIIDIINFDNMNLYIDDSTNIQIERASSELIPLPDSSVDLVISSPPYCTRIDYAIATSPELALLGCSMHQDLRNLRNHMIGTPTIIKKTIPEVKFEWGPICRAFLNAVKTHNSKASNSYYYKYYIQYFDAIYRSLLEIDRTLIDSGQCVLVVQDSYYKEIHNDLPKMFVEMAGLLGWNLIDQLDFHIKRTMASRNNRSKKYRNSSKATESVLIFKKRI